MQKVIEKQPHRRYNILTDEWVLVSPHRTQRPWQGKQETIAKEKAVDYDATCYLCPTNTRANGCTNPNYDSTFVFTNDYAALLSNTSSDCYTNGLLKAVGERGICKVVCFSPNHSRTLSNMETKEIAQVITTWQKEYKNLGNKPYINHVQIFENKGGAMGCSNPHPHGQIWAQEFIPTEVQKKTKTQKEYFEKNNKSLLQAYVFQELEMKERIIYENESFVSMVPFWAIWPFEALILPKRHIQHIDLLTTSEIKDFAQQIKTLTQKYDKVFNVSFPYSSGIHQSPTDVFHKEWHMHMSFYPPLLRSATVKKFMVGYEMFGMPQRDITAEIAAKMLKDL